LRIVAILLQGSGKVNQGHFRPGIQADWGEGGPDPAADVEMKVFNPVQPLRERGQQLGQTEIQAWQTKLNLAAVIMAR